MHYDKHTTVYACEPQFIIRENPESGRHIVKVFLVSVKVCLEHLFVIVSSEHLLFDAK